jgi:hypothetical protein
VVATWCRAILDDFCQDGPVVEPAAPMRYAESVVDLMGNTPLVRLNRVTAGVEPLILAKVEYLDPGGSVKDRIAVRMIEAAEADGRLRPGGTLVEPTSCGGRPVRCRRSSIPIPARPCATRSRSCMSTTCRRCRS